MGIGFNGSGDFIRRTTALPSDQAFTICGWAYATSLGAWEFLVEFSQGGGAYTLLGWTETPEMCVVIAPGNIFTFPSSPAVNTWYFWALVSKPGAASYYKAHGYWATPGAAFVETADTTDATTWAAAIQLAVGNNQWDEYFIGYIAYVKVWDAVLTAAELYQEMYTARPQRYANLHLWTPLWGSGDVKDYSGNGKDWTAAGTLTTQHGPPVGYGAPVYYSYTAAAAPPAGGNPWYAWAQQ